MRVVLRSHVEFFGFVPPARPAPSRQAHVRPESSAKDSSNPQVVMVVIRIRCCCSPCSSRSGIAGRRRASCNIAQPVSLVGSEDTLACLEQLRIHGLVCRQASYNERSNWRLTHSGVQQLACVQSMRAMTRLYRCGRTDQVWEDYTLFELWDTMRSTGWHFEVVAPGAVRALPAFSREDAQALYVPQRSQQLPRYNMIVHLEVAAGTRDGPIPPAKPEAFYLHILHPQRAERGRMHDVADMAIADASTGAPTLSSDEAFRAAFPAVEDAASDASDSEDGAMSASDESSSSESSGSNGDSGWGCGHVDGCGWGARRGNQPPKGIAIKLLQVCEVQIWVLVILSELFAPVCCRHM